MYSKTVISAVALGMAATQVSAAAVLRARDTPRIPSTTIEKPANTQTTKDLQGPVFLDFGSPAMIQIDGTHYAFGNGLGKGNGAFKVASSQDLIKWDSTHTAAIPTANQTSWIDHTKSDSISAPDVVSDTVNGGFLLYFTALTTGANQPRCVGVARSQQVLGPYVIDDKPLYCPEDAASALDATHFYNTNPAEQYIVYTHVGTNGSAPEIRMLALESSGAMAGRELSATSKTVTSLFQANADTVGNVIGSPFLFLSDETNEFTLFFTASQNATSDRYSGVATSKNLLATYTEQLWPLLLTDSTRAMGSPGDVQLERTGLSANATKRSDASSSQGKTKRTSSELQIVFGATMIANSLESTHIKNKRAPVDARSGTTGSLEGTANSKAYNMWTGRISYGSGEWAVAADQHPASPGYAEDSVERRSEQPAESSYTMHFFTGTRTKHEFGGDATATAHLRSSVAPVAESIPTAETDLLLLPPFPI